MENLIRPRVKALREILNRRNEPALEHNGDNRCLLRKARQICLIRRVILIFRRIVEVIERVCHRCTAVIAKIAVTISGNNRGQIEIRRHFILSVIHLISAARQTGLTFLKFQRDDLGLNAHFIECLCVLLQRSALGAVLLIIDNLQLEITAAADFQISVVVSVIDARFFEQLDCCLLIEGRCLYAVRNLFRRQRRRICPPRKAGLCNGVSIHQHGQRRADIFVVQRRIIAIDAEIMHAACAHRLGVLGTGCRRFFRISLHQHGELTGAQQIDCTCTVGNRL